MVSVGPNHMIDIQKLQALQVGDVLINEALKLHSSWQIGGPADVLIQPSSVDQLSILLHYIRENNLSYIVIGDGSNLLFDDSGFRGVVINLGRSMSDCRIDGESVLAQTGIAVPRLARKVGIAGLSGIEHTVGIPGTLGGLVAMNGGSQRKGIGEKIKTVRCVDESGRIIELQNADCEFSYRHSIFLEKSWIITGVVLQLQKAKKADIVHEMLQILRDRRCKFPRRFPNCGSVFKSDPTLYEKCGPPGKVIEELEFKGFSIGDAQVSPQHANFIINKGHASAIEVLELIDRIRFQVHQKKGIWLECEVRHVSPEGIIRPAHLAK